MRDELDGKDRELKKSKRESDKLRREVNMLKEEISIIGSGGVTSIEIASDGERRIKRTKQFKSPNHRH